MMIFYGLLNRLPFQVIWVEEIKRFKNINTFKVNRLIAILCLIFFTASGYSQIKFEKEERIKKYEVPPGAVLFVESMKLPGRIKWFRETGYDKISFEGKTKNKGRRFSIEFSEDGTFEDIEVEIQKEEILPIAFTKISEYLQSSHAKYKIDKVQIQYSGDTNLILNYLLTEMANDGLIVNYEIVITTKVDGTFARFEYLFDKNGDFIRKSKIKLSMSDNIEF